MNNSLSSFVVEKAKLYFNSEDNLPDKFYDIQNVKKPKAPVPILWRTFIFESMLAVAALAILLWYFNSQTKEETVSTL